MTKNELLIRDNMMEIHRLYLMFGHFEDSKALDEFLESYAMACKLFMKKE